MAGGITLREYMEIEESDPTEPRDFYEPCASDTPGERRVHSARRRLNEEETDGE